MVEYKYILLHILLMGFLLIGGCDRNNHVVGSENSPMQSRNTVRFADATTKKTYAELSKEISVFNADYIAHGKIDSWLMSTEHLFVGYGDLRERVIAFDRMPGALDLLFAKIVDRDTTSIEVLAVSEMLRFYTEWDCPGDEAIKSTEAANAVAAVRAGHFAQAQKDYPDAPLTDTILRAARKASIATADKKN